MAVKGKRAPYARRSVWYVVGVLAAVVVVGFVAMGYEIYHLHNQVNSLGDQVNSLRTAQDSSTALLKALAAKIYNG